MVSRRKILSRSRDDLTAGEEVPNHGMVKGHTQDDTWYSKEKLYKDHVEEVLRKWESIDDEIWAKAIVMERNKRVAKAYARAPVLTINGGTGGFDGYRLGLNGFSNPMRDPKTEEFKESLGQGAKVKMDESGNILLKRLGKAPVYVKNTTEDSAVSNDLLNLNHGLVDIEKPFRVFDMRKFQQNVNRELRRANPDRTRLEQQCVTAISFVKNEPELLDSPIWVIVINIVALEMLKAKLPQAHRAPLHQMQNMAGDPKRRFPLSGSSDEDPYSLTSGNGSSGSSGQLNRHLAPAGEAPLIPKKERDFFVPQNWSATSERKRERSRDNFLEEEPEVSTLKPRTNNRRRLLKRGEDKKKIAEDPYYCGFTARVPQYNLPQSQPTKAIPAERAGQGTGTTERPGRNRTPKYREPGVLTGASQSAPNLAQIPQVQPFWWHSRLYPDHGAHPGAAPSSGHYQGGYYDRHLPFTYTPHTPNEFSSFQFSAQSGLGSRGSGGPPGNGPRQAPGPAVPGTPVQKGRKKQGAVSSSRQAMFSLKPRGDQ